MNTIMSRSCNIVFVLTIGLLCCVVYADLPAEVPKCEKDEKYCLPKRVLNIMEHSPKGNSKLELPTLEKLSLSNVILSDTKGNGPIQLLFKYNKADVYGFENIKFRSIIGNEEDLDNAKYEIHGVIPNVLIKGDYDTQGKILLLPINGRGDSEITLKNAKFTMKLKLGLQTKDGKRYAVVKNIKIQLEPELMQVHLENLFGGNKELEATMHEVINENWKDIWVELSAGINRAVEKLTNNLIKGMLSVISYDDLNKEL